MMPSRRQALQIGGALLAGLGVPRPTRAGVPAVAIRMQGNSDGSQVWFDPIGIHVEPGATIKWTNLDPGNSHTATAYHPRNFNRPLRIPQAAEPWNSDYLLPHEEFSVTLTIEGVYDFFCIPHEHAGMVGRIVVGRPGDARPPVTQEGAEPVPEIALRAFPSVDEIVSRRLVRLNPSGGRT
jgi:plastocyanin